MAPVIDKKLSSSIVKWGRFYLDEDITECIQDQEAKYRPIQCSDLPFYPMSLHLIYIQLNYDKNCNTVTAPLPVYR